VARHSFALSGHVVSFNIEPQVSISHVIRSRASRCLSLGVLSILILLGATKSACAQGHQSFANSDPTYRALRDLGLSGEAIAVKDMDLKRDAGTFHLHSGTVCFTAPVQGRITGAVFVGDGNFILDPPSDSERKSLKLLTKEDEFSETFQHLVLRFTDSTYQDLMKDGAPGSAGCDVGLLKDSQNTTRHRLKNNLEARLLEEVLSPEPRPLFVAFIHGKRYSDKEIYEIEPNYGIHQVSLRTYDENKAGLWALFNVSEQQGRHFGKPIRIEHQQLETTIEKNGNLSGKATTTLFSERNGLRVVEFNLFRPLRVESVQAEGQPLFFIQEDKDADGDFAVILPKTLAQGETYTVSTNYAGKGAVINEGGGNYFPVARENWYPSNPGSRFGEFVSYDMTFRIPDDMKMAATGILVSDRNEAGQNVTVWKSEAPQAVAGFSFGKFKVEEAKLTKPVYLIQSFANQEAPSWVEEFQRKAQGEGLPRNDSGHGMSRPVEMAVGSMSTTGLNKKALAEGELAVQLYTDYFGPSLFTHMQLTQQTACNFGQSWPELVWIPICYYFDTTVRHALGVDWGDRGYWKVVTPHEVAHQWWGHTVGFNSGRDQWMSEGFADMSASLYLSMIERDEKKFIAFWNDERDLLLERDPQGFRAIDVGPLTMGYRADNSRTGFGSTRRLIYPKGAYVLHMIRMMMHDNRTGDQLFKETMQDFVNSYRGKAASTEDFKGIVEKHMTREMDLENNQKMDWFFNEYVYGTQLPSYQMSATFDGGPEGVPIMNLKLVQSGVDNTFRMLVPIYLELGDGKVFFLGRAHMVGNSPFEQKIRLNGLKDKPRRAIVNYYDDVLASKN